MSMFMITVVEKRDVVTRILIGCEEMAKDIHSKLRVQKPARGWLTVTMHVVEEAPGRDLIEKMRADVLLKMVIIQ